MSSLQKTLVQATILALILSAPVLFAQSGTGTQHLPENLQGPSTSRISPDALSKLQAVHRSGFSHGKWTPNAPAGNLKNEDIYKNSIILQHGNTHTLLPRHSVIYLPESCQKKVVKQAKGEFVPWPQFYTANRNWLFTHQINLKQAKGEAPIKKNVLQQFRKINRVVVALYQHNPISALPSS